MANQAGGLAAVVSKGGTLLDAVKSTANGGVTPPSSSTTNNSQVGNFGGKVITGDGSQSYDSLSKPAPEMHFDPTQGRYTSANPEYDANITKYGIPIGPDGRPNFDQANNEIRKMFGLPEMQYSNGVKMYKDPATGRWIADPNSSRSTPTPGPSYSGTGVPGYANNQVENNTPALGERPEATIRNMASENPGAFIPTTSNGMRGRLSLFDPKISNPTLDTEKTNQDIKDINKNIPQVNKPGTVNAGGLELGRDPGQKFDVRNTDTISQIQSALSSSDSELLRALASRIHTSEKGEGRGAGFIGGFGSRQEATNALMQLQKSLDPEVLKNLKISVEQNKANGKFQIQFRGDVIPQSTSVTNPDEAPGGVIDQANDATTNANAFNQELRDLIGQMIIQAQLNKSGTHSAAQDALGREIPGVGETSPEQEAQVQRQIEAMRQRGVEQISRDFNTNVRGISADLLNRGFASSNVVEPNLEEGAFRPADVQSRDLMRELVTQENSIRDSIANRQNAAVTTLNNINEPGFPTNVPGVEQYQPGTFTPKATYQDITNLAELFMAKIPGMDQAAAVELAKSVIAANSQFIASPSGASQVVTAASGIASGAAQGYAGK